MPREAREGRYERRSGEAWHSVPWTLSQALRGRYSDGAPRSDRRDAGRRDHHLFHHPVWGRLGRSLEPPRGRHHHLFHHPAWGRLEGPKRGGPPLNSHASMWDKLHCKLSFPDHHRIKSKLHQSGEGAFFAPPLPGNETNPNIIRRYIYIFPRPFLDISFGDVSFPGRSCCDFAIVATMRLCNQPLMRLCDQNHRTQLDNISSLQVR